MKTTVGVNVLHDVDNSIYLSHNQLWFEMGKFHGSKGDQFIMYNPNRTSIDNMRNFAAKVALETESDYLMFIDDDMVLYPNTYKSLREADKDIVMALTTIRGYPFPPMHFIDKGGDLDRITDLKPDLEYASRIDENGLVKCDAIGCACVLIKTELFKKIDPPYFVTGPNFTEDVYFCLKLTNALGKQNVSIYVDTKVPTGHLGEKEVFTPLNAELKKKHYEEQFPEVCKDKKEDSYRGDNYLAKLEESFK